MKLASVVDYNCFLNLLYFFKKSSTATDININIE